MRILGVVLALLALAFGFGANANACIIAIDKSYNEMLTADGIFVGEMIAYEPTGFNDNGNASQALVTYRVDEALMGQVADQTEVYFPPINYQVPDSRAPQGPEIVSFWRHSYQDDSGATRVANMVVGGPCVGIYVLDGRQQNVAAVKGWIADGVARPSELYSEEAEYVARKRAERRELGDGRGCARLAKTSAVVHLRFDVATCASGARRNLEPVATFQPQGLETSLKIRLIKPELTRFLKRIRTQT